MSLCRSCDAPIVWAETEPTDERDGKRIPLDALPNGEALYVSNGNLAMTGRTSARGLPIVRYVVGGGMRTHFASCPNAKQHRR